MIEYLKFHAARHIVELLPVVVLGLLFLSVYSVNKVQEAQMKRRREREELKRSANQ